MNKRLRLKILKKFNSQREFADALGTAESVVSDVLRGRRVLSHEKTKVWAKALGTKAETLEHMSRIEG